LLVIAGQKKIATIQIIINLRLSILEIEIIITLIQSARFFLRAPMFGRLLHRIFFFLLVGIFPLLCLGCSSAILSQRGSYLHAYHEGDLIQAEQQLGMLVQKEIPQRQYTKSKEASWLLLDRATTRFTLGKIKEAVEDYAHAIESLDYYTQDIPIEQFAQIALQDETGAYQADDFEQVLARVYFALALLQQGDESNAYALLRQAEEYQQAKRAIYAKVPFTKHYCLADNGLSKYLFATLLEKRGDKTNANLLYQQAFGLIPYVNQADISSHRTSNQATVLVICHNGNVPHKISTTSSASVASTTALELLLSTSRKRLDPAWSSLTGIPVPALRKWPFSNPIPTFAEMDGLTKPLVPFYNVSEAAALELEQKLPVIVARGVARFLIRRGTVGYLQEQDPTLGALADLTMCIVNSQTRADTRSWTTLPAFIDVARFDVDPGTHCLSIQIKSYDPLRQFYQLILKPHDLCVIHIFNIHPGITRILIPNRYLANQGDSL
jgi:hypothetical protein